MTQGEYEHRQREHVKDRGVERYREQLNRADIRILSARIRDGEGIFLEQRDNYGSAWAIRYLGRWFIVLYDGKTQQVSTLLPRYLIVKYQSKIFGKPK